MSKRAPSGAPVAIRQAYVRRRLGKRRHLRVQAVSKPACAHHARAERWHWHVVRPAVGAQHRLMMALPTRHRERPHAVGAHVAVGHRRSGQRSWSCAHAGEDTMAAFGESCRRRGHALVSLTDLFRTRGEKRCRSAAITGRTALMEYLPTLPVTLP
jgi:hypothetical protein